MATATATATKTPEQQAAEAQQQQQAQTQAPTAVSQTVQQAKPATTATTTAPTAQQTQTTAAPAPTATGQTPAKPASTVGSNLPAYAAAYNAPWMQQANNIEKPGVNTSYQAPTSLAAMGVSFDDAKYNPTAQAPQWGGSAQWTDQEGTNDASYEALNQILTGDGSGMDTSAMKNRLKEQRLQMGKDERNASQQAAASRWMLDSGYQQAQERRINAGANKDILGGFRDVDIAAAQEGTKNKLAATEALESVLSGRTTRADVGFENTQAGKEADFDKGLEGAKFKEGQDQFGAEFGLNKANAQLGAGMSLEGLKQGGAASELAKWGAGTDAQLKGQEQDLAVAQGKTNELLGRMGLAVNLEDIAQRSDRDKKQFLVDMFRTLVENEQHNSQLGLGYSQLGQSMNEMMANMAKSIGM